MAQESPDQAAAPGVSDAELDELDRQVILRLLRENGTLQYDKQHLLAALTNERQTLYHTMQERDCLRKQVQDIGTDVLLSNRSRDEFMALTEGLSKEIGTLRQQVTDHESGRLELFHQWGIQAKMATEQITGLRQQVAELEVLGQALRDMLLINNDPFLDSWEAEAAWDARRQPMAGIEKEGD